MYKVRFYLDTNAKRKNGYSIKVETYCTITQLQRRRSSGYYQNSNKFKQTPELTRLLGELQDRVDYANRMNLGYDQAMDVIDNGYSDKKEIEFLKQRLAELEKKDSKLLIDFINEIIHEKETKGLSTRHFEELIREMVNWQGESLDINDITYRKLREYEHFKRQNSNTNGAIIHKTIRTLKAVYKEAKRRGFVHNLVEDPFEGLKILVTPKPKEDKAITKEDLVAFRDFKPKKGTTKKNLDNMIRARDLFMFQIYIGGHDMAEIAHIKWSDIHEVDGVKRIRFQRIKLRNRNNNVWVDNAITPEAQSFIDKYGTPDEERIFGWIAQAGTDSYKQQNGYQRKTLARICGAMNIPKLVTKTPRTIFRSVGGQLGINQILLQQMMGHKPRDVSNRYQQDLSHEAQDKAHRDIIDNLFTTKVQKPNRKAGKRVLQTLEEMQADFPERNPNLIYL